MGKKITVKRRVTIDTERYKKKLNDEQYKAVIHDRGASLIIAGAGTGKTRALTYKVAYLIENGVAPQSIILVTFTKKAAQEMINRVEELTGAKARSLKAGTFHHLANMVLHKYGKTIGLNNNFSVLDASDQRLMMKRVIELNKPNKEERKRFPNKKQMIDLYSHQINWAITLKKAISEKYPQYEEIHNEIKKIITDYGTQKRKANQLDFDDLLLYLLAFLQDDEKSKKYKSSVKHVLVDEYQDVNGVQSKIIDELSFNADSYTVVGDDAQSIYRFRGADFTHMAEFPENNPGSKQYKLERNYRSTPEILNLANASIAKNKKQFKKVLWTDRESGEIPQICPCNDMNAEAALISQLILDYRDDEIPLEEQAVLFRSKHHMIMLERELIKNNIPYEVRAGLKFFEKAHIKDLISIIILAVNQKDIIQWDRALTIHKGISSVGASKIVNHYIDKENALEQFILADLPTELKGQRIQKKGFEHLKNLQKFYMENVMDVKSLKLLPDNKLPTPTKIMKNAIEYMEPLIKENYKNNFEDRINDLHELLNFVAQYNDLGSFIVDILTQFDLKGQELKDEKTENEEKPLILTTIHQSKGLEWNVVYVMRLLDGDFPSSRSLGSEEEIEEERRLFYVAATRAKDFLYLTYPKWVPNFGKYDKSDTVATISRFLKEIKSKNVYEIAEIEYEE